MTSQDIKLFGRLGAPASHMTVHCIISQT